MATWIKLIIPGVILIFLIIFFGGYNHDKLDCGITYPIPDSFRLSSSTRSAETPTKIEYLYQTSDTTYGDYMIPDGPYAFSYDQNGNRTQNLIKGALIDGARLFVSVQELGTTKEEYLKLVEEENKKDDFPRTIISAEKDFVLYNQPWGTFEGIYAHEGRGIVSDNCYIFIGLEYNQYVNNYSGNSKKNIYLDEFNKLIDSFR
ncbi:MAG: hypothetical protein WC027_01740 [Candidatus Paceibacterota bacterium]